MSIETPQTTKNLTAEQVAKLESLCNVDPDELFGVGMDLPLEELPPHARTYYIIGLALQGQPLDSWGGLGMYPCNPRPEFKDFDSVTYGLSPEEKVKFFIVLGHYQNDLRGGASEIHDPIALETIRYASQWVQRTMQSADDQTKSVATGLRGLPAEPEEKGADEGRSEPIQGATEKEQSKSLLPGWLKKIIGRA